MSLDTWLTDLINHAYSILTETSVRTRLGKLPVSEHDVLAEWWNLTPMF